MQSGSGEQAAIQDIVAELEEEPKELSQMYNDYATPHRLWPLALEMVALANFNDAAYIRQLWDVYLRQVLIAKRPTAVLPPPACPVTRQPDQLLGQLHNA